jgi:hypothetical protein
MVAEARATKRDRVACNDGGVGGMAGALPREARKSALSEAMKVMKGEDQWSRGAGWKGSKLL